MLKWFGATLVAALVPWPAIASTPVINGSYAVTNSETCQQVTNLNLTTGQTEIIFPGISDVSTGTVQFTPSTGKYTGSAYELDMSAIYENKSDGTHVGNNIDGSSSHASGSYSNTATTLTLDNKLVYHITYSALDKSNVAQSFSGILKVSKNCFFIIQAIHQ